MSYFNTKEFKESCAKYSRIIKSWDFKFSVKSPHDDLYEYKLIYVPGVKFGTGLSVFTRLDKTTMQTLQIVHNARGEIIPEQSDMELLTEYQPPPTSSA